MPASEENNLSGQQIVQQGAVVRVPPVPNTQHKQDKKDAGKAILRGRRVERRPQGAGSDYTEIGQTRRREKAQESCVPGKTSAYASPALSLAWAPLYGREKKINCRLQEREFAQGKCRRTLDHRAGRRAHSSRSPLACTPAKLRSCSSLFDFVQH